MPVVVPLSQCIARPSSQGTRYLLTEHLLEVAHYGGCTWKGQLGRFQFLARLVHDAGKAQAAWQRYIRDPTHHCGGVSHAFLGAALFFLLSLELLAKSPQKARPLEATVLQLTADIAHHHGELRCLDEAEPPWRAGWRLDCLEETDLDGLLQFVQASFPPLANLQLKANDVPGRLDLLLKMWRLMVVRYQARRVGSIQEAGRAVVEARLGTADLITADRFTVAGMLPQHLCSKQAGIALAHLSHFCRQRGESLDRQCRSALTGLRQQIQRIATAAYVAEPTNRFYALRVATGLGKTLTALRVGLEACRLGRSKRIVYVAPYLSILSQAAKEIRQATGLEVIEHHHLSTLDLCSIENEPQDLLSMESWQAPIVATTFNQLFRTLSPRYAQETIRMEALKRAFVILDEPQIVDGDVWHPFLALLEAFAEHLEMGCLMITATMPPLDGLCDQPTDLSPKGLVAPCRYVVRARDESMDEVALADELVDVVRTHGTVAVILNTIGDVGRVFEAVRERRSPDVAVFALHGAMTSLHKQNQIARLHQRLDGRLPTIVVATQIIEAGIDLSFRAVYRARSIIPSIMQAAGRANRHAEQGESMATVIDFEFRRDGINTRRFVYEEIATRLTDELLATHTGLAEREMPGLCEEYFRELLCRKPGTSTLAYLKDAAVGHWSNLQSIGPYKERRYRISVFVPNEGPWIDKTTRVFLARFDVTDPEELYDLYLDRPWMSRLSFPERKAFMGLMQRFTVPLSLEYARAISNLAEMATGRDQPLAICVLRQPHLYSPETGFGGLVRDVDQWIFV